VALKSVIAEDYSRPSRPPRPVQSRIKIRARGVTPVSSFILAPRSSLSSSADPADYCRRSLQVHYRSGEIEDHFILFVVPPGS